MPKTVQESLVFFHSVRWPVPHTEESCSKLRVWLQRTAKHFVLQAEDTDGTSPCYRGHMQTRTRVRARQLRRRAGRLFRDIEIGPCSSAERQALREYMMRSEARVAGPWADREGYLGCDLWSDDDPRRPSWQHELDKLLAEPPSERTMYWVHDPVGNSGKTKYVKSLDYRGKALALRYGRVAPMLSFVCKFPGLRIYAWDLTRAKPGRVPERDLGLLTKAVKDRQYETATAETPAPHVLVFSSCLPSPVVEESSGKRWEVYHIQDNRLVRRNTKSSSI